MTRRKHTRTDFFFRFSQSCINHIFVLFIYFPCVCARVHSNRTFINQDRQTSYPPIIIVDVHPSSAETAISFLIIHPPPGRQTSPACDLILEDRTVSKQWISPSAGFSYKGIKTPARFKFGTLDSSCCDGMGIYVAKNWMNDWSQLVQYASMHRWPIALLL